MPSRIIAIALVAKSIDTWGEAGLNGEWKTKPISLYGRNNISGTYEFFRVSRQEPRQIKAQRTLAKLGESYRKRGDASRAPLFLKILF